MYGIQHIANILQFKTTIIKLKCIAKSNRKHKMMQMSF